MENPLFGPWKKSSRRPCRRQKRWTTWPGTENDFLCACSSSLK